MRLGLRTHGVVIVVTTPEPCSTREDGGACKMRVKAHEHFNTQQQGKQKTETEDTYITALAYGKNANFALEYITPGRLMYYEGSLRMYKKNFPDGKYVYCHYIRLELITMLPKARIPDGPADATPDQAHANIASAPDSMKL